MQKGSFFIACIITAILFSFAVMDVAEFIRSGIIETYCLGFTSNEENMLVEKMAAEHPEVKKEIERVGASFNQFLQKRKIQPSPAVKTAVMNTIYSQQASLKKEWVPLMNVATDFARYIQSATANKLKYPEAPFDNIYVQELPSTREVINFAVWAKSGHEEEAHHDRNEYIAILDGSCDMYMDGKITSYKKGEIIPIMAGIPHHAVITFAEPMFALVQRQLIS